jgi:hypothetical protein
MSKKKNTLKDLDEFLKQQAATLVSPDKLSEKVEEAKPAIPEVKEEPRQQVEEVTAEKILSDLKILAKSKGTAFQKNLYDLIIQSLEAHGHSLPEDKMLINTALYLKNGENWKEAIRDYWREHK